MHITTVETHKQITQISTRGKKKIGQKRDN